ncbi:MAG: ATP-binding protein, partial [Lachnospiraceae bacterium]|nr:ATP-binding protein [Lachnospiraceae bacterium]
LLGRLVRNLVENALKYSKENTPILLEVSSTETEVLLSVKDRGIGIAPEDQEKIWKRFYQVDSSRSSDEGNGLGLSMVEQIAHLHDGYMTLHSIPGIGSTFTLHLPPAK